MDAPEVYIAICAIMKDEAAHVLEWIAFHHALGVERFVLYDNGSTDDTAARLAPLIGLGLVELVPWPQRPGQMPAYEDFAARHGARARWAAFIDLDEFVTPVAFSSLPEWLSTLEAHAAVTVQWLNFGPSGHELPPPGLLIEAYRTRLRDGDPVHGHVKSIVRMDSFRRCIGPHAFEVAGEVVDAGGRPIAPAGGDYSIQPAFEHGAVRLNHYYTRSRSEWADKVRRGRADLGDDPAVQRQLEWFEFYRVHATVPDAHILRFAPATRAMLDRFAALGARAPESSGHL